jgi:hypothetical protein
LLIERGVHIKVGDVFFRDSPSDNNVLSRILTESGNCETSHGLSSSTNLHLSKTRRRLDTPQTTLKFPTVVESAESIVKSWCVSCCTTRRFSVTSRKISTAISSSAVWKSVGRIINREFLAIAADQEGVFP